MGRRGKSTDRPPMTYTVPERVARLARAVVTDPIEVARYLPDRWSARHDGPTAYAVDPEWEAVLHRWLKAEWPCSCAAEVEELWQQVRADLEDRSLAFGRFTYGAYSDGDLAFARAVWSAVVHGHPDIVVETGVARGVTTRVILEALERNACGRLWSIDLPHPFEPGVHDQTALAVPEIRRGRWRYVRGSSRRRLPGLVRNLGHVDVFIHDSLHTARNVLFEMREVASVLPPGGVMIIDDIDLQQAFVRFAASAPAFHTVACPAADGRGIFGLALRERGGETSHLAVSMSEDGAE
jgi:hypothetical protein